MFSYILGNPVIVVVIFAAGTFNSQTGYYNNRLRLVVIIYDAMI